MIRQTICPRCQGKGMMRHYDLLEYACPVCGGRGRIYRLVGIEDRLRPAPPCSLLLARALPLGGRTSGVLLVHEHQPYHH